MKPKLHAFAGVASFLCIASFWTSTLVAELFLTPDAVVAVKVAIAYALIAFVPCMAITGATGFAMGGRSPLPLLVGKRRRMPVIAANGLLVLLPAAIYLSGKAQAAEIDAAFYAVQGLELIAGTTNLILMGLNIRDGLRLSRQFL